MSPRYKVGDEVQCVSDPSRIGTVVEICEFQDPHQWYRVNFGSAGRPKMPEVDLRSFKPNLTPFENLIDGNIDGYQEFQRLITFQRLLRDYPLRNNVYAFNASRTRFFPYQFKPLLKFLDAPKHRLLIADEVGLGKTIEAGLILTEVRARQTVQRVLVVCPANLTQKWRMELKRRFGEEFEILDARGFNAFLRDYEDSPHDVNLNGIISLESIRQQNVLDQLEALSPSFDLVIVDEAHHMRNFGRKQRKAGVLLSQSADAMLFLTATPIHLGNENLFSLLNILDDEEFPDLYTVDNRFHYNEPIIKAMICMGHIPPNLDEAVHFMESLAPSPWTTNNPTYSEVLDKLRMLSNDELDASATRRLILDTQRDLAELNLIGHIFTRTKKREVQTGMGMRKAYPIHITMTNLEELFYNAVTAYVREESEKRSDFSLIQQWMLITPQRRMASSIPAMVEHYREHFGLDKSDLSEDIDFSVDDLDENSPGDLNANSAAETLQKVIAHWPRNGSDSKYEKFIDILRKLKKDEKAIKVMVFAFFKDTLRYLLQRLTEDGFKAVIISGDIQPQARVSIVEQFKDNPTYEVLLSSKVGSEGLDFQFCSTLFNYDLPWNPMEVEQRIGRLDRIGQDAEIIRIYNFWIQGTIEQRILERLYERIKIFERSIGELEMILGEEFNTIEKDILSKKLSPEEEERLIVQKAMVIESRLQQLESLEKQAAQFIGTDQYFDEEVQMIKKYRRYVTGEQMRRFIVDYIRTQCPKTRIEADQNGEIWKLYPDENLRSLLTRYGASAEMSKYFAGGNYGVSITFDSQTAFDAPNMDFINVLHPIPQAIVKSYSDGGGIQSNAHHVVLKTDILDPGLYIYFINRLIVRAAKSQNTLEMVILNQNLQMPCGDDEVEAVFGEMVEQGQESKGMPYEVDQQATKVAYERAKQQFHKRIDSIREGVERNNDAFIDRRLESLRTSYGKNLRMKKEQLEVANTKKREARYIRMLEGTIRRLETELRDKEEKLEAQRRTQVEYHEISAGILEVI
jgi:superfamily II DNA or RNA helicase